MRDWSQTLTSEEILGEDIIADIVMKVGIAVVLDVGSLCSKVLLQ